MKIRYKIALLFSLLVSVLFLLAGFLTYQFIKNEREERFRTRVKNRALSMSRVFPELESEDFSVLNKMDTLHISSLYDKSIGVLDPDFNYIYYYSDVESDTVRISHEIRGKLANADEYYFSDDFLYSYFIKGLKEDRPFIIMVAARDAYGQQYLEQLKNVLFLITLIVLIITALVSLLFASTVVRPIARISSQVNRISLQNLDERIKVKNTNDELQQLSRTFNDLLDRLQESFAAQRRFISNASHELSTPLTSVSSQLEVALQKSRTPDEYRAIMSSVKEDIISLQQLTKSLLDIANIGSGGAMELHEVRIDELLFKVADDIRKLNPDYRVLLRFNEFDEDEKLLSVYGNYNLLYIALKNIMENGCKYSFEKKADVIAEFTEKGIVILVINKGEIIPEQEKELIFQPFYRAAAVSDKQGSGLGLTLSKRILSLHNGTISVASDLQQGTVFTVSLPH